MKKSITLLLFSIIITINLKAQLDCETPYKFESNNTVTLDLIENPNFLPESAYGGYLEEPNNHGWFQFLVTEPGDLTITIDGHENDVNFICWGPAYTWDDLCDSWPGFGGGYYHDHSNSPNQIETCIISDAPQYRIYHFLVTSSSEDVSQITFSFEGEATIGNPPSIMSNSPVCEGDDIFIQSTMSGAHYWSCPGGQSGFDGTSSVHIENATINDSGLYIVEVMYNYVYLASIGITVIESPDIYAGDDQTIEMNSNTILDGQLFNNNIEKYDIKWYPEDMVLEPDKLRTKTVNLFEPITFTLQLIDTTYGCITTDEVRITPSIDILNYPDNNSDNDDLICLYPNPTKDFIKIMVPENLIGSKLSIVSADGKTYYENSIHVISQIIDLSKNFSSGKYTLIITSNNNSTYTKNFILH